MSTIDGPFFGFGEGVTSERKYVEYLLRMKYLERNCAIVLLECSA